MVNSASLRIFGNTAAASAVILTLTLTYYFVT